MPAALIHFSGGQTSNATILASDLGFYDRDNLSDELRAVRDYVEKALNAPTRPHWAWIGDVYVFSQGVSGVVPLTPSEVSEERIPR